MGTILQNDYADEWRKRYYNDLLGGKAMPTLQERIDALEERRTQLQQLNALQQALFDHVLTMKAADVQAVGFVPPVRAVVTATENRGKILAVRARHEARIAELEGEKAVREAIAARKAGTATEQQLALIAMTLEERLDAEEVE